MKLSELIEKDRQQKQIQDQQILNQANQIKQNQNNKKLTYYNFFKEQLKIFLKNPNITPQQKATAETRLFNVDENIKKIKKAIQKN